MSKKHSSHKTSSAARTQKKGKPARKQNLTWLWIGLGVLAAAVAGFLLLRPKTEPPPGITPAQAYEKYQQGAFLLDVRTQEEWDQVRIANTTLIPLDELKDRLGELPQDQEIVVVCRSGNRSKEALEILNKAGIINAVELDGGIKAWDAAGYPLEGSLP